MRSRHEESKARTQKLIEQARKEERERAYQQGFEAGKKSISASSPSGRGSSVKLKKKSK